MPDSLGDRMKRYEQVSHNCLAPRMPIIVRVDGKGFHQYAKSFPRPFDSILREAMVQSAIEVAEEMQGFKVFYHQSDEASFLLTDYEDVNTQCWFDYDLQKLNSICASIMAANFNAIIRDAITTWNFERNFEEGTPRDYPEKLAYFDCRAFNVPREDVANYFLWRAKDWERNSLAMYCASFFSHKELQNKGKQDRHDMLHSIGKNWATDLEGHWKNGTFVRKNLANKMVEETEVKANYLEVALMIVPFVEPVKSKGADDKDDEISERGSGQASPA
jgi:tRNA(His) guanylyltransferase